MAASPEGGQELSQLERQLLEEARKSRRSEIPKRVHNIFENLLFDKVKVTKESDLEDVEGEQ